MAEADPLFAGMSRLPRLKATCPACAHECCGNCGQTFHFDEALKRNVTDGDFCCKCDHRWQERDYDIPLTSVDAFLALDAPRTVEEANWMLETFKRATGKPLVVSPAVYDAMVDKGISTEHVKRNDPLPVR